MTAAIRKMDRTVLRTMAVGLLLPALIYLQLRFLITSGIDRASPVGLLLNLGFAAFYCAVGWFVIRPRKIQWVRWPWWAFALLGAGFVAKALAYARTASWQLIAINLLFYLFANSLQEEFLYRGCIEDGLRDLGTWPAAIVTGLLFGLVHGPLDYLNTGNLLSAILANFGRGMFGHLLFRWFREKGGLLSGTLVHALINFKV